MTSVNNSEFQAHTERINRLVQRVTGTLEGEARDTALELLQSVMDLHGAVLGRAVEVLQESGEPGRSALAKLGLDPLVCGLLVLYGVHPVDLQTRIAQTLEKVKPQLRKRGGTVELLGISEGVVRVKLQASGHGCGNSPDVLRQTIEQTICEAAPEITEIEVEGASSAASGFVPLSTLEPVAKKEEEDQYEKSAA